MNWIFTIIGLVLVAWMMFVEFRLWVLIASVQDALREIYKLRIGR